MSQKRRNPAVSDRATSTTTTLSYKANRPVKCADPSCCWRGTCPIHDSQYPPGFNEVTRIMGVRPYGPVVIGDGDCILDLHPEVRARRLAAEVAVRLRWEQRPVARLEPGCAGGGSANVLRASWESLAAKLVAA